MEVRARIRSAMHTWKKLETFWKHANCSTRFKLQVYNAVIRVKLMYGIETAELNETTKQKIGVFQLKGLRQILKITNTYVDRLHSNEYVFKEANEIIFKERENPKLIIPMSQFYEQHNKNSL